MFLQGGAGKDSLKGGVGADTIYGFGDDDTLHGREGDDVVVGHEGDDLIYGEAGDDWLVGGLGDDLISGGAGIDWASYEDAAGAVIVDLAVTVAQDTGAAGLDRLAGIENLYGSAFDDLFSGNGSANTLNGAAGEDALFGRSGHDVLHGGDGDDWLGGGLGNDYIEGGAGQDWASYEDAARGVAVDLRIVTGQNTLGAGTDTLVGVERLYGSAFNDSLTGDAAGNLLFGGDGADRIAGGAGDDTLHGGQGDDQLDGGDGVDTVSFDGHDTGVFIQLRLGAGPQQTGFGNDSFVNIENVYGTEHRDWISGDASANSLHGAAGDDYLNAWGSGDTLDGGAGDDILTGTVGNHTLLGGDGSDTFVVPHAGVAATIDLAKTGAQAIGGGMTYTLSSVENLHLMMGANTVWFSTAANSIRGGSGADTYVYRSLAEIGRGATSDTILNWSKGDRIDVSKIDANSKLAGNQAFAWATEFTRQAGQAVATWDAADQIARVQFDTNGDGKADAELFLHGAQAASFDWIL